MSFLLAVASAELLGFSQALKVKASQLADRLKQKINLWRYGTRMMTSLILLRAGNDGPGLHIGAGPQTVKLSTCLESDSEVTTA